VNIEQRIERCRQRVDAGLQRWLDLGSAAPERLVAAMRYSAIGGGKRIRPLLVYTTGLAVGVDEAQLDGPACAVELIHAYSLVHDDLPAMDDDDLRRGRPTCHRAFDEATAILAGDALQVVAFQILASDGAMVGSAARRLEMIRLLAEASGPSGMAGGQAIDLQSTGRHLSVAELENMHMMKTGALIRASVMLGALSQPELPDACRKALERYAGCVGLAFQIQDDILDVEGDPGLLGKTTGADAALSKPTYPSIAGLETAKARALELHRRATEALAPLGARGDCLAALSGYIVGRRS
jgi:farnesyl diphosphate synthase